MVNGIARNKFISLMWYFLSLSDKQSFVTVCHNYKQSFNLFLVCQHSVERRTGNGISDIRMSYPISKYFTS